MSLPVGCGAAGTEVIQSREEPEPKEMRMTSRVSILSLCFCILFSAGAAAQQGDQPLQDAAEDIRRQAGAGRGGPPPFEAAIESLSEVLWLTETDGEGLEVTTVRARTGLTGRIPLNRDTRLDLGFRWEQSFYDFDGVSDQIPGARDARLNDFIDAGFSAQVIQRLGRNWGWFLRATMRFSGEPGANFGDSLRGGAFGGAEWRPDRHWTFRFGAGGFSRIEEDPLIIPVLTARWVPNEDWSIDIGFPESRIDWRAGETWGLFFAGRFDFRDFRLDQDGPLEDGVLRDDAIRLELGMQWDPNPDTRVRIAVGLPVWREISFDDRNGDQIIEADLDPGATLRAELRITF